MYIFFVFTDDLGGSMGLFVGCSVLTLFEFVDVLVLMCISRWRRKRQTDNEVKQTSEMEGFHNEN
jgi:hypothetical protein